MTVVASYIESWATDSTLLSSLLLLTVPCGKPGMSITIFKTLYRSGVVSCALLLDMSSKFNGDTEMLLHSLVSCVKA